MMNIHYWIKNEHLFAGTTLKNIAMQDANNTALHTTTNPEAVIDNRKALSKELGIDINQWIFLQQTHSDHLFHATKKDCSKGVFTLDDAIHDYDAIYTTDQGVAIGVFTADCVPILLYDETKPFICAIHSGWVGTVKEITSKVLKQVIEDEHLTPEHLHAYIGPAINYESLEVGLEVVEKVKEMHFDTTPYITYLENGKALIDNKGLNYRMLTLAKIKPEHITVNEANTFLPDDTLFSYRRDHACGRHLSFIGIKK